MSAIFILIISFVPNFIWLSLYLREDTDPEPPKLLMLAFLGGMCATGIALGFEYAVLKVTSVALAMRAGDVYDSVIYMVLGVALIEECVKFFMTRVLFLHNPNFDQPVDAMVYCIVVALGFAFAENVVIIANAMMPYQGMVVDVTRTVMFRFIGANFLHLLASGIVGYAWAQGIVRRKSVRYVAIGLIAATLLHGIFNVVMLSLGSLAYVAAVVLVFAVGVWLLRDFEVLKELGIRRSVMIAYAPPRK